MDDRMAVVMERFPNVFLARAVERLN